MDIVLSDPNLSRLIIEKVDYICVVKCYLVSHLFYQVAKEILEEDVTKVGHNMKYGRHIIRKEILVSAMAYPRYREEVKRLDNYRYCKGAAKHGVYIQVSPENFGSYVYPCIEYDFAGGLTRENIHNVKKFTTKWTGPFDNAITNKSWKCFQALWDLMIAEGLKPTWDSPCMRILWTGRMDLIEMVLAEIDGTHEEKMRNVGRFITHWAEMLECDDIDFLTPIKYYGIHLIDPEKKLYEAVRKHKYWDADDTDYGEVEMRFNSVLKYLEEQNWC